MSYHPPLPFSSLFHVAAASSATVPPFPPFPVLTQEQKREQRKLARAAKKTQKQADQLQKKIDEKRSINSGKIKLIDRRTAEVLQTARIEVGDDDSTGGRNVPQKWQSKPLTVELADSVRKPRQDEVVIRNERKADTQIPKNKGKKREVPKEKLTRLKKAILQERQKVENEPKQNADEDVVAAFKELDVSEGPSASPDIKHSRNFRP
jgi:hypothetical protein